MFRDVIRCFLGYSGLFLRCLEMFLDTLGCSVMFQDIFKMFCEVLRWSVMFCEVLECFTTIWNVFECSSVSRNVYWSSVSVNESCVYVYFLNFLKRNCNGLAANLLKILKAS